MGGEVCLPVSGARKAVDVFGPVKTVLVWRASGPLELGAARAILCQGDADFEIGADGDVKTRDKGGAVAAKIFAGSIFFEGKPVGVAPAHFQRQPDSDSTFRALLRNRGARERDHGPGPRFW